MKLKNILVVYTSPINSSQKSAFNIVKKALEKNNLKFKFIVREKLSKKLFQNRDLVIALGGDGTFLTASHFILDKTLLFGVNSDPEYKEGFFMAATKIDFEKKMIKIFNEKYTIKKLHRLEASIGNKKIPDLALNEFSIACQKPYYTARYYLTVKGVKERQKSSGILVSTAAGSYAWIKSAGGKILQLDSDKFQYLVREIYCGRTAAKCSLVNGFLKKSEKLIIEFEIGKGTIIVDSTKTEYKFKAGKKITIKVSDKPLYAISFKENKFS